MKKLLYLVCLAYITVSCNRQLKLNEEQKNFISAFSKELKMPFVADSVFIARLDTLEAMDLSFLEKIRKDSLNKDFAASLRNSLEACIFIEKLKQNGRYSGYLDSLDIGMIKNAMPFIIGKATLEDGAYLVFWGINEASYDADPFFSGTSIIASYSDNKGGFTHMVVAEDYAAGDPPAFLQRKTSSDIRANEIKITSITRISESENEVPKSETHYLQLKIKKGEVEVLQKADGKN